MTDHLPSRQQIRDQFATIRKLVQFTGQGDTRTCALEEALIDLVDRERRSPTALVAFDGYGTGAGDGRGGAELTSVESAVEANVFGNGTVDPVGPHILTAVDMLAQAAMSASAVRNRIGDADRASKLHRPIGQTAALCCEEGCDDLAVPGGKGRCEADRKWLERHPDAAVVPREVIAKRSERRRYETGPYAEESA